MVSWWDKTESAVWFPQPRPGALAFICFVDSCPLGGKAVHAAQGIFRIFFHFVQAYKLSAYALKYKTWESQGICQVFWGGYPEYPY